MGASGALRIKPDPMRGRPSADALTECPEPSSAGALLFPEYSN